MGQLIYCEIADLLVEIPETEDLYKRCQKYLTEKKSSADIIIRADLYDLQRWPELSDDETVYLQSGFQFYSNLVKYDGILLHSSAIEYNGKAYLFSGPSGMGKSTHTKLWQQIYGNEAQVFNDDKPALRRVDGKWYAYGTPWCGKDGINQNKKIPLGGICFLKRGTENKIRYLEQKEIIPKIMKQTMRYFNHLVNFDSAIEMIGKLILEIPIFELECLPNEEAAVLSSTTMCRAAQEANL